MIEKVIVYLVLAGVLGLKYYKERANYILYAYIILLGSFFASTPYFQTLPTYGRVLVFLACLVAAFMVFRGYIRDAKQVKLDVLRERRALRDEKRRAQDQDPTRKKKVVIVDQKTKEERVYWASPSLEDRLEGKEEEDGGGSYDD